MTSSDTRALTTGFAAAAAMLWVVAIWTLLAGPVSAAPGEALVGEPGASTRAVVHDAKRAKQRAARAAVSERRRAAAKAKAAARRTGNTDGFRWPVDGAISSRFGRRGSGFHHGDDIECGMGEKVRAARAGRVILSGRIPIYGHTVVIEHARGWSTLYAHFSKRSVRAGETVVRGQVVGRCGSSGNSTGPHVHFEIRRDGRFYRPSTLLP